jgi:transposase
VVCFVDAAHFVHGIFLGHPWCFTRLLIRGPSGRKRFDDLGAIDAVTHELTTVTNGTTIDAAAICELLKKRSARYPGLPMSLVLGNARYRRCEPVRTLAAELLYLPPYSPNLNLFERLWKFVKKEVLSCRYYEDSSPFKAAIVECLDQVGGKRSQATRRANGGSFRPNLLSINDFTNGDEGDRTLNLVVAKRVVLRAENPGRLIRCPSLHPEDPFCKQPSVIARNSGQS